MHAKRLCTYTCMGLFILVAITVALLLPVYPVVLQVKLLLAFSLGSSFTIMILPGGAIYRRVRRLTEN